MNDLITQFKNTRKYTVVDFMSFIVKDTKYKIKLNVIGPAISKNYTHLLIISENDEIFYCWQLKLSIIEPQILIYELPFYIVGNYDKIIQKIECSYLLKYKEDRSYTLNNFTTFDEYIRMETDISSIELMNIMKIPFTHKKHKLIENMLNYNECVITRQSIYNNEYITHYHSNCIPHLCEEINSFILQST
jgi:hypothetical protein